MNESSRDVSLAMVGAVDAARLSGVVMTSAQVNFVGVGASLRPFAHGAGCGAALLEGRRARRDGSTPQTRLLPGVRGDVRRGTGVDLFTTVGWTPAIGLSIDGAGTRREHGYAPSFKPFTGCPPWSPPV